MGYSRYPLVAALGKSPFVHLSTDRISYSAPTEWGQRLQRRSFTGIHSGPSAFGKSPFRQVDKHGKVASPASKRKSKSPKAKTVKSRSPRSRSPVADPSDTHTQTHTDTDTHTHTYTHIHTHPSAVERSPVADPSFSSSSLLLSSLELSDTPIYEP